MAARKPVADIMSDYQLEANAQRQAYLRKRDASPELVKLDQEIASAGLHVLENVLAGKPTDKLSARLARLQKAQEEKVRELAGEEYLCSACRDTGRIGSSYCTCLRKRVYLEHCGARNPLHFAHTLETLQLDVYSPVVEPEYEHSPREIAEVALRVARKFVAALPSEERGLLFLGEPGLGKTWFVSAIARQAAENGIDTAFFQAPDLFDLYYEKRRGLPVDTSFLETAQLLIIDDLGTEPLTTNVTIESLLRILTKRHDAKLPTVVSSNITSLQARYGERVSSRLHAVESFGGLRLIGSDLRTQ